MDYDRRLLFILRVSFLIAFIPITVLIGKGVLGLAFEREAEIEWVVQMTRAHR